MTLMHDSFGPGLGLIVLVTIALVATGCATTIQVDAAPLVTVPTGQAPPDPGIRPGQCFTEEELGFVDAVPVSCGALHIAKFFGAMVRDELPDAPWPELERIQGDASAFCHREFARVAGVAGEVTALDILFFRPDVASWEDGDREIACFVRYPSAVEVGLDELDPMRSFGLLTTFGLRVGDCIADASLVDDVAVRLVDCDEPHRFEICASVPLVDGPFPGTAAIEEFTNAACDAGFEVYVGAPRTDSTFVVERVFPTEESWGSWGDRLASCALTSDGDRTGSARGSGS